MSTDNERLAVIQQNYNDALANEPDDLARAKTAAQVTAIQANVASARSAYYAAVAAALTKSGPDIEQAFADAKKALSGVRAARQSAAQIATLLTKLASATKAATHLLELAKS